MNSNLLREFIRQILSEIDVNLLSPGLNLKTKKDLSVSINGKEVNIEKGSEWTVDNVEKSAVSLVRSDGSVTINVPFKNLEDGFMLANENLDVSEEDKDQLKKDGEDEQ